VKLFVPVLLGVLIASVLLWAATFAVGLLAVWSPWPREWWAHHPSWVWIGSEMLVYVPAVVGLGFIFSMLYKQSAVLSALAAVTIALVIAYGSTLGDLDIFLSTLRATWGASALFLVVPPLTVAVVKHLRSNNRWRGP